MSYLDREVSLQRQYYASTASEYDAMHLSADHEHDFALSFLVGMLDYVEANSLLDVGAGTGRTLMHLRRCRPSMRVCGVEPSAELRAVAHLKGIDTDQIIDGDAMALPFEDGAFDVVSEFAVLHHLRDPSSALSEMLRVARRAIFVSDSNNFGQGRPMARGLKQALHMFRLWPFANYLKTRGKGYQVTPGDGLAYSYSVFSDFGRLKRQCRSIHVINTVPAGMNPYRTAGHVALLAIK